MFNKRFVVYSTILLMIFFFLPAGCAAEKEAPRNTDIQQLNFAWQEKPQNLDPAKLASSGEHTLVSALFEGLVRVKPDGTLEKALAEDWQVDNNGMKYTFYLRDASWSNGAKITASDFAYAWKRSLDPVKTSPYSYLLFDIKNAENYNRSEDPHYLGKRGNVDSVAIEVLNDKTLVVELKEANTAFLKKLAHPVFYPLPSGIHQSMVEDFFKIENIVNNGPFQIEELGVDSFLLKKNEEYWDQGSVKLTGIKGSYLEDAEAWELFNKGDLDLVFSIPQEEILKGINGGKVRRSPLLSNYFYDFNTVKKPLDDIRIRKALSLAIDRKYLVENNLMGGQTAARGYLPGMLPDKEENAEHTSPIAYNPETAKELFAEAGFHNGEGFPVLEVLIREGEGHQYLASVLKEQWKSNLNIDVSIVYLKWDEMIERLKKRDFDLALQGLYADYPDHLAYLEKFTQGSGNNYTGWTSRQLTEEIRKLKSEVNDDVRKGVFIQAEKLILDDMPVLPIYDFTQIYAAKQWVKGLYLPTTGAIADFKWTYLD